MDAEKQKTLEELSEKKDLVLIPDGEAFNTNYSTSIDAKTQADAVLYFLQCLDIAMISNVLDDKKTYQNFEKPLFIKKLGSALDEFIEAGDTYLNRYDGVCNSNDPKDRDCRI
jgi:hypothetical protein